MDKKLWDKSSKKIYYSEREAGMRFWIWRCNNKFLQKFWPNKHHARRIRRMKKTMHKVWFLWNQLLAVKQIPMYHFYSNSVSFFFFLLLS